METHRDTARTGDVSLPVGVINTGDSTGIVYNRARLNFDGKELWLSAKTYTAIKAQSVEEIEFEVPDNDQDAVALARWKELVKSRKEAPFELILKTGTHSIKKSSTLSR